MMKHSVRACFLIFTLVEAFVTNRHAPMPLSLHSKIVLRMATSSSDLKDTDSKKRSKRSVVSRLSKAAKEAASKRAAEPEKKKSDPSFSQLDNLEDEEDSDNLASIISLSRSIDEALRRGPSLDASSMRSILEHNDQNRDVKNPSLVPECKHVAIVFSKPLYQDQITTEYAARLVVLARAIKYNKYQPAVICFCGKTSPTTGVVAETSAGVIFFRHLCATNQISLENTEICIVPHGDVDTSWSSSSLNPVVDALVEKHYLEDWLLNSEVYESKKDEFGLTRQEPRKKVHVHWTLISTDYHLCNLNDIHMRSPRQSPLHSLEDELEHAGLTHRGIVKATWCFNYVTNPYLYSQNDLTAFLCKCYLMAQDLRPLLVNLRGVANEQSEFFQRDNYRALVATRRSLVNLLEEMNEAFRHNKERETAEASVPPNLKAQLQRTIVEASSNSSSTELGYASVDVALESALLSLGRCLDLVRPAGTLSSKAVSRDEWKNALRQLEHFLELMESACDPDRPLPPEDWGKLSIENMTTGDARP